MAGLTWDGTRYWMGGNVNDKIYQFDTAGNEISSFAFPTAGFSEGDTPGGLTWDGTDLWFAMRIKLTNPPLPPDIHYEARVYQLQTDGTEVTFFEHLADVSYTPGGLAWDGTNLWLSDRAQGKIYNYTTTGSILDSWSDPGTFPTDLTWLAGFLWLVDRNTDKLYKLTTAGAVVGEWNLPALIAQATGLTWRDGLFRVLDQTGFVYTIDWPIAGVESLQGAAGAPVWVYTAKADALHERREVDGSDVSILAEEVVNPSAWLQPGGRRYVAFDLDGDCQYIFYDEDTWGDPVTIRADRTDPAAIPLPQSRDVMIVCKDSSDNFYLNFLRWNGASYDVETEIDMSTTGNQTGDGWVQAGGAVFLAFTDLSDDLQTISSDLSGAVWV